MRENTVRLSFDVPEEEHIILKTGCAQLRISIKDFLRKQLSPKGESFIVRF